MENVEVHLVHQTIADILLSVCRFHAYAAYVGCLNFVSVIKQCVRQRLQSRHHATFNLTSDIVFAFVYPFKVHIHKLFRVVEYRFPQLSCFFFYPLLVFKLCQRIFLRDVVFF